MTKVTIGILGGGGFVGTVIANRLVEEGYAVRIFTRDRERARDVWLLPDTDVVVVDPLDQDALSAAITGCAALINLVGILNEKGHDGEGFRRAHVEITAHTIRACKDNGIGRLLQMSALKADSFAPSYYLRTKGEAEKLVLDAHGEQLQATIMRPSVIFGPHDDFMNRFAALLRLTPGVFPLACASARFQPVYVGDVATAFVTALDDKTTYGKRYDLGGPEVMTLAQIVRYVADVIGKTVVIIPLGKALSAVQANILEYVPGKPLSRDNLRSTEEDSVLIADNGLLTLGITPTAMDVIVPTYLADKNQRTRYYGFRTEARRGS